MLLPDSSIGAIGLFASVLVLYKLSIIIHNLFLHPLRKYPGPWFTAVSQLPNIFVTIIGKGPFWVHDLHLKYGPVVRIAPNELSYTDVRAWKDIYGIVPSRPYGMPRESPIFEYMEDEENRPSLLTSTDTEHSRIRRAYAPAFSLRALAAQESMLTKYANQFVSILRSLNAKDHINIVPLLHNTIFDMVGHFQYGESLGILEHGSHKSWTDSSGILVKVATILAALSDLAWFKFLLVRVVLKAARAPRQGYFAPSNDRINRRLAQKNNTTPDLVGLAFQSIRKNGLSERDIRANAHLMMTGGTETTVSLVTSLTALLLSNPDTLIRVKSEIRNAFTNAPDLSMTEVSRLPYLNACINEALRLRPPISGPLGRNVPKHGANIAGAFVPEGTRVYVSPLAAMRSEDNFHYPDMFLPDRWLEGASASPVFGNDKKAAFHPFSHGRRDCIGQELAYAMARLMFCKLIVNFDLRAASDLEGWHAKKRVWTAWVDPPLYVDLIPVVGSGDS